MPQNNNHKYHVYRVGTGYGCFAKDYRRDFLGTTWAVSEKQACNRIRYRVLHQNHFDVVSTMYDSDDQGYVKWHLEAVLASEDKYVEEAGH